MTDYIKALTFEGVSTKIMSFFSRMNADSWDFLGELRSAMLTQNKETQRERRPVHARRTAVAGAFLNS
jgi:hypothetical protein